ncbi:probable LRR receptor-like serine/threonine-protein kinase At1g05700 [Zingiber officinale]|uniref:probable LRR receptor-like serine/threonine-protein kinase At1g05700 n=1 Tax=Zingiber officinale TaxID=94328 RepID=UPI001C4BBE49|nr:probable LRR receptor-like serine/threonine-protein kinase At1g05700 [Zingiber officinale]
MEKRSGSSYYWFWLLLQILLINVLGLHCHRPPDSSSFISIDCGIGNGTSFVDSTTGLTYVSDEAYIDLGKDYTIDSTYLYSNPQQQATLRSFPNSTRSCYTLRPVVQYYKYLVRANFLYGNYDGLHEANTTNPLEFDVYIDVNMLMTISIQNESLTYSAEALIVAVANNSVSICLVNTGNGVPFISSLELRPMNTSWYKLVNSSFYLQVYARLNLGATQTIRYPTDPSDRIWTELTNAPYWTNINTTQPIEYASNDEYGVPVAVMQTAVTASGVGGVTDIEFFWDFIGSGFRHNQFYTNLYFSEFDVLLPNQSRAVDIFLNGEIWEADYPPPYLVAGFVCSIAPLNKYYTFLWDIKPNDSFNLPPILNAVEVFSSMYLENVTTNERDVDAINVIKAQYKVKKQWTGDPCSPVEYRWAGLNCSYISEPPSITAVNLSSSELTGEISPSFSELSAINYLFENVPPPSPSYPHNNNTIIIVISVIGGAFVLMIVVVFVWWCIWKRHPGSVPDPGKRHLEEENSLYDTPHPPQPDPLKTNPHIMRFPYSQLIDITNNFARIIGKGGFGVVFRGCLETGKQVAVKLHFQSSPQGEKQFVAEVQNLTRIHHMNLVELIGYCIDGEGLALVYEYMDHGSLHDHLRGKAGRALSWSERLKIAIGAAEGLEYLHHKCHPPIIHRDIKSSNILLGPDLEAKIADFGLSKAYRGDDETNVSTNVVGTPGYVDPEYHNTLQLTAKSDVYSFGVLLFELLTGQLPLVPSSGKPHIMPRVTSILVNEPIDAIMDPRLGGQFDANSAWKVEELAEQCTQASGSQRPTMTKVILELKDSLELEAGRLNSKFKHSEDIDTSQINSFEIGGDTPESSRPFAR